MIPASFILENYLFKIGKCNNDVKTKKFIHITLEI